MAHKQRTTASVSSSRTNRALRQRIEVDLAQLKRCQHNEHAMQATQSPGVVVCTFCRMVGVCLWCGVVPPPRRVYHALQGTRSSGLDRRCTSGRKHHVCQRKGAGKA
jgi:hypothetical protein